MAFKGDDSTLSLATTVTLALAVAAMVFVKEPLKSSRPSGGGMGIQQAVGELSVPARLWEDPFAAVEKGLDARKQVSVQVATDGMHVKRATVDLGLRSQIVKNDGLKSLLSKIKEAGKAGEQLLTLVVMTGGGSSVEHAEARIRDRYAVGAALEVGCFIPEKSESLSYFTWKFAENGDESVLPQYTPYEWYSLSATRTCPKAKRKSEESISQVVVLWVKSAESDKKILARIHTLLSKVYPPGQNQQNLPVRIKLVGPRNSSEFGRLLKEIEVLVTRPGNARGGYRWPTKNGELDLYSPWATAPAALLAYGLKEKSNAMNPCASYATCKMAFGQLLMAGGLALRYSIGSDEVVFDSLMEEFDQRRVKIGHDRIVLIGEWDSVYARALPLTFSAAACQHLSPQIRGDRCVDIGEGIDKLLAGKLSAGTLKIMQYSYLSGLDGEASEDRAKRAKSKDDDKAKDRDKGEGKGSFRDIASYERPEGQAQLDYVRRLVARIKAESEDHKQVPGKEGEENPRKVKAIGILGRDAYDALLILQAVREKFPNALFFATDLDARYFHEDELKWTRNLIVASQFGLQLEPSLQQSIPPFRSSLQTSTFFAVLQAIDRVKVEESEEIPRFKLSGQSSTKDSRNEFATEIPPRLFEIGRHGAVDLSPVGQVKGLPTIHPARTDVNPDTGRFALPPKIGLLWIVGLTVGFLMLWGYGRLWNWMTAREAPDQIKHRLVVIPRSAWILIPVIMLLWILGQIVHLSSYAEDEPFSWSDGVSIWPTEALRFIAICLCLFFLLKARADSVHNIAEISRSFFPEVAHQKRERSWRNTLMGFGSDVNWMFHGSKQEYPRDASNIWLRYCRAHGLLPRAVRVALGLMFYVLLFLPLVLIMNGGEFRLSVPCRGTFSCTADAMFLSVSVLSLLILNLASLDAVILCIRWIRELPAAVTHMPPMRKIRLLVERSKVVNRRILHPFVILFLLIAARSHYFDNWDFPPVLILALTVNSLVAIASATMLYLAAVGAKRRILEPLQHQLDDLASSTDRTASADQSSRDEALRRVISDIDGVQQGAFVPFYQQPMVQATLVAALAFLQYWYFGQ